VGRELIALGGAFLASGLLARAGRRLGLPTIPFFMAAGIIFGPHTPGLDLVREPASLELLATLGLIFLLFHLGLEFSIEDLVGGGRALVVAAGAYLALNLGCGVLFGLILGWGTKEALVLAGIVGISSSAIVTKLLVELGRLGQPETSLILGIIVVEDVFLAVYLAAMQPVLTGAEGGRAARDVAIGFGFLVVLVVIARWGSRIVTLIVDAPDDELLTVCFVGVAILVAGIAAELGVSDAIGALLAGMILSATALAHRIERLVRPLRDTFAAIFFFAFGLTIDPSEIAPVVVPVLIAVVLTVIVNLVAGVIAARAGHHGRGGAARIATTVLARGELSLILASLAVAGGLDARLGPFVGLYVLVLALGAPILAARSEVVERLLPRRLLPSPAAPVSAETASGSSVTSPDNDRGTAGTFEAGRPTT